jgi:16S rRNA (adenine1518-N6/adenine1519-N6)-dimethyltransferase
MPGKLTSIKTIKQKLTERSFAPRKSLGQNFLIDDHILQKIVAAGALEQNDLILEVGPGLGALTEKLIASAGRVVAIEYDRGLFAILSESFANSENLVLLNQDILETDLQTVFQAYSGEQFHYKVLANLPYYITTPVIFKLIESGLPWELMVILVQKEVAERLIAKAGTKEYGALTVMLNFFGKVEKLGIVPKTVFYPSPQVDSAIVRITLGKSSDNLEIYPYLHQVVQAAFGQRRKTILNALASLESLFGCKELLAEHLRGFRIDPGRRGETLSLEEFLRIAVEIRIRDSQRCINEIHQPN